MSVRMPNVREQRPAPFQSLLATIYAALGDPENTGKRNFEVFLKQSVMSMIEDHEITNLRYQLRSLGWAVKITPINAGLPYSHIAHMSMD